MVLYVLSTIAYALRYRFPSTRFWSSALSVLGLMAFLILSTFVFTMVELTKGLEKVGSVEHGVVYVGAIGDLISATLHVVISMTSLYCGI